jgi:lipid-A-disaccharide synthase
LKTAFVGHPVIERIAKMTGGAELRARLGIPADAPLLCVLPGSRTNEVRLLLPVFRAAVALLAKQIPGLICVLPLVPHVAARVREGVADWPTPLHLLEGDGDKFSAFDAANAALAASGTVTTELALSRTPMVMAYKLGWLTYKLMKPLVHTPYGTLVNIILKREAVPEYVQDKCTPQGLANGLLPLLTDKAAADAQIRDLDEATRKLGRGKEAPSLRAAEALLAFMRDHRA